jgi:TRAP-type C4-dicarboxylate transport system substrate-binding protein
MPRKTLLKTCAAFAAALITGSAAMAQDATVTLRFASWLPATHPLQTTGFDPWMESITEASNGTIQFQVFPAQQLGRAVDHYDMTRDGISDISFINPGYQPGRFPVIAAGELPFQFSNASGGSAALDAWYRPYADAEMSDVKFCLAHLHAPGTFHSSTPIQTPADISGMNVRPAQATMAAFISELGGQNFQVSAPEARDALTRGVADAITFPWNSIMIFGIDQAVKYHTDLALYATTFAWVINPAAYDGLSDAQKAVIDDHCTTEWAERAASGWADIEVGGREKLLALEGHELVEISDDDLAAWRTAAEPLVDRWATQATEAGHSDPAAILEALRAEIAARGAAY